MELRVININRYLNLNFLLSLFHFKYSKILLPTDIIAATIIQVISMAVIIVMVFNLVFLLLQSS